MRAAWRQGPAATGALDRDRFLDLVRGLSIVMVVLGHWLITHLAWNGSELVLRSSLGEAPGLWPITWVFQVIPLFFFVGGFSNRRSFEGVRRRGEGYAAFLDRRLHRVLAPTGLFLTLVGLVSVAVGWAGGLGLGSASIVLQPLWFLGVYVVVVALTPATLAWHRRWGWGAVATLAALAGLVDGVRLGLGVGWVGFVNVVVVWAFAHQFGYLYADGALTPRRAALLAAGGFALLCALVAWGPYPARMVGVPGDRLTNMNPPTATILALAAWQIGVAVLLRGVVTRWLRGARAFGAVIALNLSIMSIYLWHQAAMLVVARIGLPLGLPQPAPATAAWWPTRLLWLGAAGLVLATVILAFRRAEQVSPRPPAPDTRTTRVVAGAAVALLTLGSLALAGTDVLHLVRTQRVLGAFDVSPLMGFACVAVAGALVRGARAGDRPARRAMGCGALAFALLAAGYAAGVGPLAAVPGAAGLESAFAGALAAATLGCLVRRRARPAP